MTKWEKAVRIFTTWFFLPLAVITAIIIVLILLDIVGYSISYYLKCPTLSNNETLYYELGC